jgi:hypothetical protein
MCDAKVQSFTMPVFYRHRIACLQIAQIPEHRWRSSWSIQVTSNHCVASLAWMHS